MTDAPITPEAVEHFMATALEEAAFMKWWKDSHDFDYHENGGIYETAARRWFSAGYKALSARVKELEKQNRELAMQELASLGQAQEAYEAQLAAESKLAKAVECMNDVSFDAYGYDHLYETTFHRAVHEKLADTLAELGAKP